MTNAEKFMEQHKLKFTTLNLAKLNLATPKEIQWQQLINRFKQEELLEQTDTTTTTTPSNEITVRILNKYGNDLIYPADHKAHIFADMLGQKTFTRTNIKYIKALGYKVNQSFEEVSL